MALLLHKVIETYQYINTDLSDPRSRDTFFILNPLCMTALSVVYYKFVTQWGPKWMEYRQPFKLDTLLKYYNILQILACVSLAVYSFVVAYWSGYYSLLCQPLSFDVSPIELKILNCIKYYYLLKIVDLLDTVFFVLRKKSNQISFLHVYHHIIMIFLGYMSNKYIPGGHGALLGLINCVVHAVMYTYYLLTSISPEYKKSIWWKKHITQLQIAQFLYLMFHFSLVLFQPSCTYPKWVCLTFLPQNMFMLFMFSDFYYKEYIKKPSKLSTQ